MPNDTTENKEMQGAERGEEMTMETVVEALVAAVTALEARVDALEGNNQPVPGQM
jgi:hypothetical protein